MSLFGNFLDLIVARALSAALTNHPLLEQLVLGGDIRCGALHVSSLQRHP